MGGTKLAHVVTILVVISSVCSPVWSQYTTPGQEVESCPTPFMESNFYQESCPDAEGKIAEVVYNAIQNEVRVAGGLLRVFFHDCFVEGCDGSLLIDAANNGGDAEKLATPNKNLQSAAFDVIDNAKTAVENICPETVSCADVVAYAAVTAVAVLGGLAIDIQGGRLDGFVSSATAANTTLPSPFNTLSELHTLFTSKGLDDKDMVVLTGAHTIGQAHCASFTNRLHPTLDASFNSNFASSLEQSCPTNASTTVVVNNDIQTPTLFDNKFHQNVADGKALFTSDASLYASSETVGYVNQYAANNTNFLEDFSNALIRMGQIGVKTGSDGNIRKSCRAFNS